MRRAPLQLRVVRVSRDMSQWDVADSIGISQGKYSMIERGQVKPSSQELRRIADLLRAPANSLLRPAGTK